MITPPNDGFLIMTLVRPGFATNLMSELTATGYPIYRATSAADLVAQASVAHGLIVVDETSFQKISKDQFDPLPPLLRSGHLKLFFVPEQSLAAPQALDGLTTALISSSWTQQELAEALAPLFNLNQRGAPRAIVTLVGTMTVNGDAYEGTLLSLSESGALFSSTTLPHLGAKGHVVAEDVEGDGFSCAASVVSERRLEKGVGLRFEADPEALGKIRQIVAAALGVGSAHAEQRRAVMLEGSDLVRRSATHILAAAGYQLHATSAPSDFVRLLAEAPADIVLIDPTMPAAGGDRLKEFIKRAGTAPCLLFTNAPDPVAKRGLDAGAHSVLKKGTYTDAFISRITTVVNAARKG